MGLIFAAWIVLALLTALYGADRFLGFWMTLYLSLLLSPFLVFLFLVGLDKVRPLEAPARDVRA